MTGDPSRIRTCNPRSRNPLLGLSVRGPLNVWESRNYGTIDLARSAQGLFTALGTRQRTSKSDGRGRWHHGVGLLSRLRVLPALKPRFQISSGKPAASADWRQT